MDEQAAYYRAKQRLLAKQEICPENRDLYQRFLEHQEYKLKRINGLAALDQACYKTLRGYTNRLRKLNEWFNNRPLTKTSKEDIRRVVDDLEDGVLKNKYGKRIADRHPYYHLMKGKLFEMAGKEISAKEVLEYVRPADLNEVRFVELETIKKMADAAIRSDQKLLIWLGFDVGENVGALLQLEHKDFSRRANPDTGEPEYLVNLPKLKLKRSRSTRSEITNFLETASLLDSILGRENQTNGRSGKIFRFGVRAAERFLKRSATIVGARCIPGGQPVSCKDLRSSMACHLLKIGWSTDEIRARLGHKPSSKSLDKYVNYLAIGRQSAKKKFHAAEVRELQQKLAEKDEQMRLVSMRQSEMRTELEQLREFRKEVEQRLASFSIRKGRQMQHVQ